MISLPCVILLYPNISISAFLGLHIHIISIYADQYLHSLMNILGTALRPMPMMRVKCSISLLKPMFTLLSYPCCFIWHACMPTQLRISLTHASVSYNAECHPSQTCSANWHCSATPHWSATALRDSSAIHSHRRFLYTN